ncbi:MAG: haloacid dehalogenase type II [Bacteroidota bacterium]
MPSIAFDIYGTLIDPLSVGHLLEEMLGDRAAAFNQLWRSKQLEYSFRKAAMRQFNHFTECTHQALQYTDAVLGTQLSSADQARLRAAYRRLPAYPGVPATLAQLRKRGHELLAFSNGKKADLLALFEGAQLAAHFDQVLSVDEVRTFKPAPEVYELLVRKSRSDRAATWLVSSNSFDLIGAGAVGLPTVWLQRPGQVFDPFGYAPTRVISQIGDLSDLF